MARRLLYTAVILCFMFDAAFAASNMSSESTARELGATRKVTRKTLKKALIGTPAVLPRFGRAKELPAKHTTWERHRLT